MSILKNNLLLKIKIRFLENHFTPSGIHENLENCIIPSLPICTGFSLSWYERHWGLIQNFFKVIVR